jgi:hypothetical protein
MFTFSNGQLRGFVMTLTSEYPYHQSLKIIYKNHGTTYAIGSRASKRKQNKLKEKQ